jgi:pimeloyl-ACP methyl ester carboxylesterase
MYKTLMSATAVSLVLAAAPAAAQSIVNQGTPAPECTMRVNVDRNADLPGYLADWEGKEVCLPFMPTNQLIPADYAGDFYVDEFTDARAREKWEACQADAACAEKTLTSAKGFAKFEERDTGTIDETGKIDFEGEVDLGDIRRPSFFEAEPYKEAIAAADDQTYIVEFTAPRDSYELNHLGLSGDIKLRGWYLKGQGVDDGSGNKVRALVVMNNGGGGEVTSIDNPSSEAYILDAATGNYISNPEETLSEEAGMRYWRGFLNDFHQAGFDVLITDRRGNGISGGRNGYNTAEQANDIFRELEQLDSGNGLRLLTPEGETHEGEAAARLLLDGASAHEVPVVVGGYSRGSYATQWFMQKNFVENCNFDIPDAPCEAPVGLTNVKGAILYGPNSAGLGYRMAGHDAVEGALREDFSTTYYVDSSALAGVDKWPALQIVKGTWDYVEGLEGSFETYARAKGLKDISVFLGPHGLATQHPENMAFAGERMVAFATAAVLGRESVEGSVNPTDLKQLVLSVPQHWELTTDPSGAAAATTNN